MHLIRPVPELSGQGDDFCNDEFGHTAGVAERRVEHSDSMLGSVAKVDLIGSDTEAPDDN